VELRSPRGIALVLVFGTLSVLVAFDSKWPAWFGASVTGWIDEAQTALGLTTVILAIVVGAGALVALRPARTPFSAPRTGRFRCELLGYDAAQEINDHLVDLVFPDGTVNRAEAMYAFGLNPRCVIGLIDIETRATAGWSVVCPITIKAGEAIEHGRMLDEDLAWRDLLRQERNGSARYLLLLSFCVLPQYRSSLECPTLRLARAVRDHIAYEFIRTPDRQVRLVAAAYTDEGKDLCKLFGFAENGYYAAYPKEKRPILVADVTMASIRDNTRKQ
jgi:hypothetical protein